MLSKSRHEGYLMIDHRAGEGVTPEMLRAAGMPLNAGQGLFECKSLTCSHCQAIVIVNPLRTRERPYCPKCDHYICDGCGAIRAANGGECKTMKQVIDEVLEAGSRGLAPSTIILPN